MMNCSDMCVAETMPEVETPCTRAASRDVLTLQKKLRKKQEYYDVKINEISVLQQQKTYLTRTGGV